VQTKAILYQNLWNFALLSEILFWIRIGLKKFTQVLSYVVCTQVRSHVHKKITKRRYGGEKPGSFVFGRPVLFTLSLGLTTPYSLGVLVWNFYQTFFTVSAEFSLRFEPQIRPTRLGNFFFSSLPGLKGRFVSVGNCLIFFVGEYSSVWPEICRVLSQIQWRLLRGILEKTISGEFFRNFVQTKAILYRNLWNFTLLSEILFWISTGLKKFTQVLSYVVCTQVRRHFHKKITKRRYGGEKPVRFAFGRSGLFTGGLRLTTPYSLNVLVEICTRRSSLCLLSFGWDLSPRFVPQDRQ